MTYQLIPFYCPVELFPSLPSPSPLSRNHVRSSHYPPLRTLRNDRPPRSITSTNQTSLRFEGIPPFRPSSCLQSNEDQIIRTPFDLPRTDQLDIRHHPFRDRARDQVERQARCWSAKEQGSENRFCPPHRDRIRKA